jgi:hypothetical protein
MPSTATRISYLAQEPTAAPGAKLKSKSVSDVSGGDVVDAEARETINDILKALRHAGIIEK